MCGRYTLYTPVPELERRFGATAEQEFEPRYNAAPGQDHPVVLDADPDTITAARWGLTPRWADEQQGHINARAETVTEKPSFREAFEERRCLVPADGFYEWADGQPHHVTVGDGPFAMAGIYEPWTPPDRQAGLADFDGEVEGPGTVRTYAVLTTAPNDVVGDLHHRMSAILAPEEEREYLTADPERARELLDPCPGEEMAAYPVSEAVNDPGNDRPELVEPL
ncbi:MAG: SOS response-associated peptidase [Halobacteriaceae archaeon]